MSPRAERSSPPAPGPLACFRFPPFVRAELANGVRVLAARSDAAPLASVTALLAAGANASPETSPGLASMHAALLDEGTGTLDAMAIARRVEQLGGGLGAGADWDSAAVELGLLREHVEDGLALAAEVLFDARFPASEIERARQERLAELLRRRDHPSALAGYHFAQCVYHGTVYAHPLIGTEASLATMARDDLLAFYQQRVSPGALTVVAVGDLDPQLLARYVDAAFGSVAPAQLPPAIPAIRPPPPQRRVIVVDRPGGAQTELRIGHASVPRREPGYAQRVMLNAILGGTFTSRLNLNLREHHGITYGVRSSFARRTGPGPFIVRAAVDTANTGLATLEILEEIERLRNHGVRADELRDAQQFLIRVFPYTLETAGGLDQRLEDLVIYDLPDEYYEHHPARLGRVTTEGVLDAARRFLDPEHATIVAVGPAQDLGPQLSRFGALEVIAP